MAEVPIPDEIGDIFGFPSFESFRAGQLTTPEPSPSRRPEVPLNLGFGAGSFTSDDFAGFNTGTPNVGDLSFNYSMPGFGYTDFFLTPGAGAGYGGGLLGGDIRGGTPTILDPYTVTGTRINDPSLLGIDPNAPYLGPRAPFQMDPTSGGAGVVTLPPMVVNETAVGGTGNLNLLGYDPNAPVAGPVANPNRPTGGETVTLPPVVVSGERPAPTPTTNVTPDAFLRDLMNLGLNYNPTVLPPVTVSGTTPRPADQNVIIRDPFQTATNVNAPRVGNLNLVPATPTPAPTPTPTTPTPTPTPTGGGTAPTTGTGTGTTGARRNIGAELRETMTALQANQPAITGMYKDLYQSFMPAGLKAAEASGLAQLQADEQKLARLRAGILSPEDVRTAQQGAREAYAARGQVMGPGAVGAEILNRENIRQSREDAARAAYQQSMGNILNTANLQTGNIFQPIGNLISGTFNPLGAYPADVYGTNVNADLAREIAQKNYEAAIESARLSGSAARSASTTSALGSVLSSAPVVKGLTSLFGIPLPACMPGDQTIDTPNGPVAIEDLKGGDEVIGYDGTVAYIAQASSWNQDPGRIFIKITCDDGSSITVCDDHKIMGIPAMEWTEGSDLAGKRISAIEHLTGIKVSYDILTNQGGYRINGVPVNSMIPEMLALSMRLAALNHA